MDRHIQSQGAFDSGVILLEVLTPPNKTITYPHVAQVFRVRRERTDIKSDAKSITYAYGITSVSSADASARQLMAWNRGH